MNCAQIGTLTTTITLDIQIFMVYLTYNITKRKLGTNVNSKKHKISTFQTEKSNKGHENSINPKLCQDFPLVDWQEDNSPSTVLTSNKMFKRAKNIVNIASFDTVKIEPKLGSQGRLCLSGIHGQPVIKFTKKY